MENNQKQSNNVMENKRPQLKLKELYKYYQDKDSKPLLENISPSQKNKFSKYIKYLQNMENHGNNNSKPKYNNYKILNKVSIKKNKSCPKFDINMQRDEKYNNNIDENFYMKNNNGNYNNNINNNNDLDYMNNRENGFIYNNNNNNINSKQKINNNNSDYIGDSDIFTRIVPNFEDDNDNSSIRCMKDKINEKTYNNNQIKSPKNSNFVYHKSKTPKAKIIYYNKKNKNENNKNQESPPNGSIAYNSFISNNSKNSNNSKKVDLFIKHGFKFDLDKNKKNDYMDLLTISELKNLERQQKLKNKTQNNNSPSQLKSLTQNNGNMNISNNISSPSKTNTYSTNNSLGIYSNKGIINFPKRNNYFLSKNNNNQKCNGKRNNNRLYKITKRNSNKSYDCIVFKKKIGIKKKKKTNNKRNKTSDKYDDQKRDNKGTQIKKENDKGGKVVLFQNILKIILEIKNLLLNYVKKKK